MTIYYVSVASFSQVDIAIIKFLALRHKVIYSVFIPQRMAHYTADELNRLINSSSVVIDPIDLKYRWRDFRLVAIFYSLIKKIRKSKADAIYVNDIGHPFFSFFSFFLDNKKTVIGLHDVKRHSDYKKSYYAAVSRRLLLYHFNTFQVFSRSQAELFRELYPEKILYEQILPLTPVETDAVSTFNKPSEKVRRFLFFGKILSYKGVDLLIEAVNKLSSRFDNFELHIAGSCANWEAVYKPLIHENSRIKTTIRFIDNKEIASIFLNSDFLVLPYRDVTQSGPLMIAYSLNVPVIVCGLHEFSQFFENEITGLAYDKSDPNGLVKCLESAILMSPENYDQLKRTLKEFVTSRFSEEVILGSFENMFLEVINN